MRGLDARRGLTATIVAMAACGSRCAEYPSFSPHGKQIAFDALPANPPGRETPIMVANADGTNVRVLSAVPFRTSIRPSWQPAP